MKNKYSLKEIQKFNKLAKALGCDFEYAVEFFYSWRRINEIPAEERHELLKQEFEVDTNEEAKPSH